MVDNADVVRTLGRVADLLEIRGEKPDEREHAGDIGLTGASPRRGRQAQATSERQTV